MSSRALALAIAAFVGTVLSLGAVEVALRVAEGDTLRGLHRAQPDKSWLYGLEPGVERRVGTPPVTYRINADGYRGPTYVRPKPAGTFRILVLGDSVTFGYGVTEDDVYTARLERLLRVSEPESRIEVVNLGVSGYNPYTEAALLRDEGPRWAPDLVLVQFCVNDLNDPTQHFDASTMLALGDIPDDAFPDPGIRRAPSAFRTRCDASRLCTSLRDIISPRSAAEMTAALKPIENPSPRERAWLAGHYTEMSRTAAALGAPLAVILFPFQTQVDGLPGQAPPTLGSSAPLQNALRTISAERPWTQIDLLPAFRAARAEAADALFLDLWHPTSNGHAVASRALADALRRAGFVPGDAANPS